jgi:hypothetical protein
MSTRKRREYAYYDNPDSTGRMRRYQIWWGEKPTPYGPVDVELVSPAPTDPPSGGQPAWVRSGPVEYRVRPSGQGADAWRSRVFERSEPFGPAVGAAAYGR